MAALLALGALACPTLRSQAVATIPYGMAGFLPPNTTGTGYYNGPTVPFYYFHGPVLVRDIVRGRFAAAYGQLVVDNDAGWAEGQFNPSPAGRPRYYVQITSGPLDGLMMGIIDSKALALTLDRVVDNSDIAGATYVIRMHLGGTLTGMYGANYSGLISGTEDTATIFGFWNRIEYQEFYFAGPGWRAVGDPDTDQGNAEAQVDNGLYFRFNSRQLASATFTYSAPTPLDTIGFVQAGPLGISVVPGYNLVNPFAVSDLTLGTSNLYTGDPATGVTAGAPTSADIVSIYNGSAFDDYYVRATSAGVQGWRKAGDIQTDCSNVVIRAGSAIVIKRSGNPRSFIWLRPAFYSPAPDNLPLGNPLPDGAIDAPGITYDEWASHAIIDGDRSPQADNDADGRPNLLEYFLGGDPKVRESTGPTITLAQASGRFGYAPYLQMSFRVPRYVRDVNWVVESSSDLVTWAPVPATSLVNMGDGTNLVVASDWTETPTPQGYLFPWWAPRRFIRLTVRLPATTSLTP